jgi:hypothetical protein
VVIEPFEVPFLRAVCGQQAFTNVCAAVRGIADGSEQLEGERWIVEDQLHRLITGPVWTV